MPPTNLEGKTERKSSRKNNFMWHDSFKDPFFHKPCTVVGHGDMNQSHSGSIDPISGR